MTQPLGFSTGSLAPGNVRRAVEMVRLHGTSAIELSALRLGELDEVLAYVEEMKLEEFRYVSFHAPSRLQGMSEVELIKRLQPVVEKRWPIIVHPDVVMDWSAWRTLGDQVVIENMDGRKPVGRTVAELESIFARLPEARFCFDIGHAAQIDPTMSLARELVVAFGEKLVEVHLSVVDDSYGHQPLTAASMAKFGPVLSGLRAAVILETPVGAAGMAEQMKLSAI